MAEKDYGDGKAGIQVISRAAAILRSLKNESGGLSLGQIAERVDLPRSTVQRIVDALQVEHFVIAAHPERGIRLGPELGALADAARLEVTEILRPYLVDLARRTEETVDLGMLQGRSVVFLDQVGGLHRLRTVSMIGEALPLCGTANGRACLAKMDEAQIRASLSAEHASSSLPSLDELMRDIAAIRASNIAVERDQHIDGISTVATAFHDLQGNIYAVSIPTPSPRFRRQEKSLTAQLLHTREQLVGLELFRP